MKYINKKNIPYILIGVVILVILIIVFALKTTPSSISSFELKKDTYITEDYNNDVIYENTIYVPDYMTRLIQTSKNATYVYRKDGKSFMIQYASCVDENCLNSYKSDDKFKQEGKYYITKSDEKIRIYFKNSFDVYQTIEISKYNYENESLKKDKSYKKLLENMTTKKANYEKYYIMPKDGYYSNYFLYKDYQNEDNIVSYKINYKVDSTKYQTNYDKNIISPSLYLDRSNMSFFEGKITRDISSVKEQTKIELFVLKSINIDFNNEAKRSLEWALNQNSFKDITENDVEISIDTLDYKDKKIDYYKIISNNNNSHGERLVAYLKLQDNYYYVIQITGGEGKELGIDMIFDFLPTSIE